MKSSGIAIIVCSLCAGMQARAESRSSASFTVPADVLSSTGGKASSVNYSETGTLNDGLDGGAVGSGSTSLLPGFMGQLYETRLLSVTASPASVMEGGSTQLKAVATLHDDTLTHLDSSEVKWSVQSGPLAGITLAGLATASEVLINAPATVRGGWDGISGDVTMTVLNANANPPGNEAATPVFTALNFEARMAGLYHGLLKDSGGNVVGAITGFTLKNTSSFTTKIIFNGITYPLAGSLMTNGSFIGEIKRAGKTALTVTLQIGSTTGGGLVVQGTVSGDGTAGSGMVAHSSFTKAAPVPAGLVKSYTFLVPATVTGNTLLPEGDGYGSAKLSSLGTITVAGKTGDGVAFTAGGFLTADKQWHLFQPLYSSKGQIAGELTFRDVPSISDVDGKVRWVKNPNAKDKSYPGGFSQSPTLIGAVYTPPAKDQRALVELADQTYNARLTLASSALPDSGVTKTLSWLATNKLAYYGPEKLTGTLTSATGILTGSYTDPITKMTLPFSGAVLQKQGLAGGSFLWNNKAGYVLVEPGTTFGYPGSENAGTLVKVVLPGTPATAPIASDVAFTQTAAGSYGGLLTRLGEITGGLESVVISKTGALSGTVVIQGKRHAFKGTIGANGLAAVTITRTGLSNITGTLQLALTTSTTDGYQLTGSFTADGLQHGVDAAFYPIHPKTAPAPQADKYTLAMRAPDGVDTALQPGGDGYASLVVSPTGDCTGTLTLADGTTTTFGGRVSRNGEWSLHRSLYGTSGGYVAGKLTFRTVDDISDADGTFRWVKPNAVSGTKNYPAGFDTTRGVVCSRYVPPQKNQRAFAILANSLHNAWLRLNGPDMSTLPALNLTSMDRAITWTTANTLIYYGPEKITLTFTPATGMLTGTCVDAAKGINISLGGVLMTKQGLVTGRFATGARTGLFMMTPR
jgi:hypothetical protein